ncbi:response regulator transcription factor [Neobacillus ginsengisoli]|uniref:Two-component system response regulator YesN n=1 Tax=Neobacillus ginsengisoli TaxID=904295 RepID=A0ABT9XST1_9BACI|nr:response regulator [Neobacillus ginsengisoli]MDQ0197997.1 two-component system response regulator YesN [Neobacillus ginsengisoli]
MKVLIVDDEKHVREGIKLLGAWEQNGIKEIYEAGNGEEAISIIHKYSPAIIFSDMKMPKMDGTQLLEWIKEHQPTSKTVVVTGYDDYHYMRKAIHFGSSDYLLKPIDPEILNQTLEKAVKEWKDEEAERKKKESSYQLINEIKPVYRDRKLTQILNGDMKKEGLYEEFGLHLSQNYTAALVRINGKTIKTFHGDRDLAYFTILNVINEILLEKECGIGFRYLSNKGEIVIIFWNKFEQMVDLLTRIYRTIKTAMDISCPIAVGSMVYYHSKLMDSYHQAKQVLLNSNILDETVNRVYCFELQPAIALKNLMSYSSNIELAIQAGEIGAFEELINQIAIDFIENNSLSLKQLLQLENEYLVISNRWFKNYNLSVKVAEDIERRVDLFFDQNGTFQLEEYKKRKLREIAIFLEKIKRRTLKKNSNIICDIEKYLQANFDRDVKLQEISDHFYISREYISRKFKQEFNVNISDYIVKIRMDKAKSLLKNSQLKIYEIANMIGYQDDKYFRKVFKKVEGVTPNEYRAEFIN